jgi:hypothetical protein
MSHFSPLLKILPPPQRRLWSELSAVPREFEQCGFVPGTVCCATALWIDFNPQITLKALSFFDDGDLHHLPEEMKVRLATAAREVDLDHLPSIDTFNRQIDQDRGYEL